MMTIFWGIRASAFADMVGGSHFSEDYIKMVKVLAIVATVFAFVNILINIFKIRRGFFCCSIMMLLMLLLIVFGSGMTLRSVNNYLQINDEGVVCNDAQRFNSETT